MMPCYKLMNGLAAGMTGKYEKARTAVPYLVIAYTSLDNSD
jgi:hypothetical protein